MSKHKKETEEATSIEAVTLEPLTINSILPMREVQDLYIGWAISACKNNKKLVASKLGITYRTIYNRSKFGNIQNNK